MHFLMHSHNTHFFAETLLRNGLISEWPEIEAFAGPSVFQQGAIVHAYKLIARLFTLLF